MIVTVGTVSSLVIVNWLAEALPFPAASLATPALTSMETSPSPAGVIVAEYVVPDPAKPEAAPFPTVISPTTKPVTLSEKVKVAGKAPDTGSAEVVEIVTVGTVSSLVIENWVAAVLTLPAASCATAAATSTVTAPSAAGVIVAV